MSKKKDNNRLRKLSRQAAAAFEQVACAVTATARRAPDWNVWGELMIDLGNLEGQFLALGARGVAFARNLEGLRLMAIADRSTTTQMVGSGIPDLRRVELRAARLDALEKSAKMLHDSVGGKSAYPAPRNLEGPAQALSAAVADALLRNARENQSIDVAVLARAVAETLDFKSGAIMAGDLLWPHPDREIRVERYQRETHKVMRKRVCSDDGAIDAALHAAQRSGPQAVHELAKKIVSACSERELFDAARKRSERGTSTT